MFLSNRTMSVKVGSLWLAPRPVTGGCPQGSILGVFLFNTTTDDLEDGFLESESHLDDDWDPFPNGREHTGGVTYPESLPSPPEASQPPLSSSTLTREYIVVPPVSPDDQVFTNGSQPFVFLANARNIPATVTRATTPPAEPNHWTRAVWKRRKVRSSGPRVPGPRTKA